MLLVALVVALLAGAVYAAKRLSEGTPHKAAQTHTTTSHTRATTTSSPVVPTRRVALQLVPGAPVRVCLIGYRSAHGRGLQRINAQLTPTSRARVYHADNRFRVSFAGGAIRMIINGHSVPVAASAAPLSYEIFLSGRHITLPASKAPHCT